MNEKLNKYCRKLLNEKKNVKNNCNKKKPKKNWEYGYKIKHVFSIFKKENTITIKKKWYHTFCKQFQKLKHDQN